MICRSGAMRAAARVVLLVAVGLCNPEVVLAGFSLKDVGKVVKDAGKALRDGGADKIVKAVKDNPQQALDVIKKPPKEVSQVADALTGKAADTANDVRGQDVDAMVRQAVPKVEEIIEHTDPKKVDEVVRVVETTDPKTIEEAMEVVNEASWLAENWKQLFVGSAVSLVVLGACCWVCGRRGRQKREAAEMIDAEISMYLNTGAAAHAANERDYTRF